MNTYQFKTRVYLPANYKKLWIDHDCVNIYRTDAENLNNAIIKYYDYLENQNCITVSQNARKNKQYVYNCLGEKSDIQSRVKQGLKTDRTTCHIVNVILEYGYILIC